MNLIGLQALTIALFLTAASAASKCGKKSYKSKYGIEDQFHSVGGIKASCKYHIHAPPGMHIKIVLDNYVSDKSIMKLKISPKQNRRNAVSIPSGPRPTLVVEASDVIVFIKTTTDAAPVDIHHEGVIPADGNFGYDFRATAGRRRLQTPNFSKVKLPSGVKSVWNITSGEGEDVVISIERLVTANGRDFLEILDGTRFLGRYSGKKKKKHLPIVHRASSGNMIIRLITETRKSKGFRARVYVETRETTESTTTSGNTERPTAADEGLQCHQRYRVLSGGITVSDEHSKTMCRSGEVCGRIYIDGSANIGGSTLDVTVETLQCVPSSECRGSCDQEPEGDSPIEVTVNSCQSRCCDTDMCNVSPDGPETPPGSTATSVTPTEAVSKCHSIMRASMVGSSQINESSVIDCGPNSACARVDAETNVAGMPVSVSYGICHPKNACDALDCDILSSAIPGVPFSDCLADCCYSDLCNAHPLLPSKPETLPTSLPAPADGGLRCHDIIHIEAYAIEFPGTKRDVVTCPVNHSCVRIYSVASHPAIHGITIRTEYGGCLPSIACPSITCSMIPSIMDGTTIDSCEASCCDSDLCNI